MTGTGNGHQGLCSELNPAQLPSVEQILNTCVESATPDPACSEQCHPRTQVPSRELKSSSADGVTPPHTGRDVYGDQGNDP